jgi:orotate phosphoribosyltransferase
MDQAHRDLLRQMLLNRSMRFGEFVLSSGATSNYYIDVRKTSLHPEGLKLISKMFFEQLQADAVTAVGGLTLGADPLVAGLML